MIANWLDPTAWRGEEEVAVWGAYEHDALAEPRLIDDVTWTWTDDDGNVLSSIPLGTPANSKEEYDILRAYEQYSRQQFAVGSALEWRRWSSAEINTNATKSQQAAEEWMWTAAELSPRHVQQ
ncbi:MAG: hypothetical protein ACYTKD_06515 [Planctomycetota bacterium]|jgi:hypothetical protein